MFVCVLCVVVSIGGCLFLFVFVCCVLVVSLFVVWVCLFVCVLFVLFLGGDEVVCFNVVCVLCFAMLRLLLLLSVVLMLFWGE